jgi:flagellar hook protein FlgE
MSFGIALSGINAAQSDLNVTANNVANSATNGFKQSRTEFAELFAVSPQGVSNQQAGAGVKISTIAQQFTQGNIESTNNSLDLAISGQGFFIVSDAGAAAYTRAGSFQTDNAGFVVNAEGQRLQIYPPTVAGNFNTTALSDLRLVTGDSAPNATTTANIIFNLPSNATVPTVATFDAANPNSYNNSTSMTVYDSLGAAHTASLYFVKQPAPATNSWDQYLYIDGTAVGAAPTTLAYSANGTILPSVGVGGKVTYAAAPTNTGSLPITLTVDYSATTQYGDTFGVTSVAQDGFTTGKLIGMSVDSTGIVQARFTNGRSLSLGQVAIANFANPQGMQSVGNTNWAETFTSGQALHGQAGNSGFGLIQSGSLEQSNVDITAQLVNMITAQRNFQANAQMISTENQITQTIIQIR